LFIRRTIGGSKKNPIPYLQLVRSYRDSSGTPKHQVLCTLGREEDILNSGIAESLAKKFASLSDKLIVIEKAKESFLDTYLLGQILAVESIWKKLNLDETLNRVQSEYEIEFSLSKAVKLMVLNRLIDPKSKLSISRWKKRLYTDEFDKIELQHLYRSLDILEENKDMLERELYNKTESLFKPEINLVFYDLTTIYFESQREDVLRCFGYSKENKTDCVQVVVGLILSEDDIPLGYEVFSGNTFEGKTVSTMIKKLRERYAIKKLIFVADKGILSKSVLREIEGAGYNYIVAAKIKNLPKKYHEQILDRSSFRKINEDLSVIAKEINGERFVIGYSESRAERDRAMREAVLEKIKRKLSGGQKSLIKPAYSKYLKVKQGEILIDDERIREEGRWDGYFGYVTNNRELTEEQVIGAYKMLYKIEESFRCMKSSLDVRPVYHWTERRIKGHIMLCFISFYVLRVIQRKLTEGGINIPAEQAIEELERVRAIKIRTDEKEIYARTAVEGESNQILRALGVKIPSVILKEKFVVE
jgi:transposase